jgi:NhaA family Na+:H+ antiporter
VALSGGLRRLLRAESAPGVLLFAAALAAMAVANSPLAGAYRAFLDVPIEVRISDFEIAKPLLLWVNDGLMAVFFFLVGLELKRELLEGELSSPRQAFLPVAAALGGIAGPALIYAALNAGDPVALRGWAIPAATDIAFALGVVALLGERVPRGLKVFLLSVAIVDDLGAILIIAFFYSSTPPPITLVIAGAALGALVLMNVAGVRRISPYLLVGLVLWAAVLKSGVHATIAGVLLALTIPLRTRNAGEAAPARELESDLHAPVAFGVLPLFAFANAGVDFAGMQLADLGHGITLGTAAGLFLGKQVGVLLVTVPLVVAGLARLPTGANWAGFYGVAVLTGIGFTMSLFIGSLAFKEEFAASLPVDERVGILLGSGLSALAGYLLLRFSLRIR